MSQLRFPHPKTLLHLILPTVFVLVAVSAHLWQSSPAIAKSPFSIPGLHALQKKLGLVKRRRRTRRPKKELNNAAPLAAPLLLDETNQQAAPPLPNRNPRRHVKRKEKVKGRKKQDNTRVKWKRPAARQDSPIPKPALREPERIIEEPTDLAIVLPPLPIRKPRRHPSQVEEPDWTPTLIKDAVEQCIILGVNIKPLPPVRKGRCGNPAPVLLEQVNIATVRPAATLSCPMIAGLRRWFEQSVQPLAQKHFGEKVKQIRNVSSYVCRNRYGDTKTRISEHAYANALDIAWFELQSGEKITVLDDWANPEGNKSAFLHELHSSACELFGTVLGPDANAAHKDHFHLDKAPRKYSNYCR
jgi:hypothetical protein